MTETRSERIAVKITPTLHAELVQLAEEIGQAPASLAAVYLGEAINKKRIERENSQRMAESVGNAFKEMFAPTLSALDKAMAEDMPKES
ncbi:hypothetical protein [Alteromonas flava]|uniref:hypothetical protein n=1 Tax=Alteromonas flava TaxID=2048003 RepID=UPI000C28EC39|nr:hypothetical protein [Alteromonas flava]